MAAAQTRRGKAGAKDKKPEPQHPLIQVMFIAVCVGILVNIMLFMMKSADEAARGKHRKPAESVAASTSGDTTK